LRYFFRIKGGWVIRYFQYVSFTKTFTKSVTTEMFSGQDCIGDACEFENGHLNNNRSVRGQETKSPLFQLHDDILMANLVGVGILLGLLVFVVLVIIGMIKRILHNVTYIKCTTGICT